MIRIAAQRSSGPVAEEKQAPNDLSERERAGGGVTRCTFKGHEWAVSVALEVGVTKLETLKRHSLRRFELRYERLPVRSELRSNPRASELQN